MPAWKIEKNSTAAPAQVVEKNSAECYYVSLKSPGSVLHNHRTVVHNWGLWSKSGAFVEICGDYRGAERRFRVSGFGLGFRVLGFREVPMRF